MNATQIKLNSLLNQSLNNIHSACAKKHGFKWLNIHERVASRLMKAGLKLEDPTVKWVAAVAVQEALAEPDPAPLSE